MRLASLNRSLVFGLSSRWRVRLAAEPVGGGIPFYPESAL